VHFGSFPPPVAGHTEQQVSYFAGMPRLRIARTAFLMLPPANSYERPSCSKSTLPNGACRQAKWNGSLAETPQLSGSSQQPDGMGVTDILETSHLLWQHEAPQLGTQGGRRHGELQLKADAALEGCVQAAGLQVPGCRLSSMNLQTTKPALRATQCQASRCRVVHTLLVMSTTTPGVFSSCCSRTPTSMLAYLHVSHKTTRAGIGVRQRHLSCAIPAPCCACRKQHRFIALRSASPVCGAGHAVCAAAEQRLCLVEHQDGIHRACLLLNMSQYPARARQNHLYNLRAVSPLRWVFC
jgi:hypothetical protein